MTKAALLSPSDVGVIRRYVHTKYAPLSGSKRAEIVADAIRRTLRKQLPQLPNELNDRMIDELISRCLVSEQREVQADDVLDVCAELKAHSDESDSRWLEPIVSWANERAPGRWSAEQLESRLTRRRGIANAVAVATPHTQSEAAPVSPLVGRNIKWSIVALLALAIIGAVTTEVFDRGEQSGQMPNVAMNVPNTPAAIEPERDIGLPAALRYTDIDAKAVKQYLKTRDALLADEPYFGAIVASAKDNGIHPLLLLAITGQEQGFVPKSNKNAKRIANNPFNVFHSWQEYNTNIRDSSDIAAGLLAKLADRRPEGVDPFEWFNETYAEDDQWAEGVRKLFEQLSALERL
ncbi:hypothetical protein [Cohnella yongneupensis]|uniref:Mannosyl-glycoprotein endo-beta-N-acetylglucosaminidase n=1 Tax=Cohnella yongneupensis TaxID=425006 RepID=A0ABW0R439_9BACL